MHAMILAAGRGERMRPLTDRTPKPLLEVAGKPLIEYQIENLVAAGITDLVINVCWLREQIINAVGDGSRWGITIQYSVEHEALETAGGIIQALPLLGEQPFLVVNADIWTDYPYRILLERGLWNNQLAHIVLVLNPDHHPNGDFLLDKDDYVRSADTEEGSVYTFSGIALYSPAIFAPAFYYRHPSGRQALRPLLEKAMRSRRVSGELFTGQWQDIGTPDRLQALTL